MRGYFSDFYNVIDWGLIVLSFLALAMRIGFSLSDEVQSFDPFATEYTEMSGPATQYNFSFAIDAIAAAFGIVKIFRFFDLQRNLHLLRESIIRGLSDLGNFTGMLLIILIGFAVAGNNIFGQENIEYIDLLQSSITLFLMILGEFDFDEIYRVNAVAAYIFFLVFQIFIFLIMVNIFLAILNDSYLAIKEKFDAEELPEKPPPPSFRQRIANLRAWVRQRSLDKRIEELRKVQRTRELSERRAARKLEEARLKTLKGMGGLDGLGGEAAKEAGAGKGKAGKAAAKGGKAKAAKVGGGTKRAPNSSESDRAELLQTDVL